MIASVLDSREGEEIVGSVLDPGSVDSTESSGGVVARPGDPDWDSGLPERTQQSLVEVDRSEPQDATGSSKGRSSRRVAGGKTDD